MKNNLIKRPLFYIWLLLAALLCFMYYCLIRLGVMPLRMLILLVVIGALMLLILGLLWLKKGSGIFSKIFGWILAVVLALTAGTGSYYLWVTSGALNMMTQSSGELKKVASVYVLNNHVINDPKELEGRTIGILNRINTEGSKGCIEALDKKGIRFKTKGYDSSIQMVSDLKGQAIDGAILDQSYIATIEDMEGQHNIREEIVPVFDYQYAVKKSGSANSVDTRTEPFNVLVSGIDTYGAIEDTSRSDVNMIVSVNPKTHTILLVSVPRDYYVETVCDASAGCAQGKMDKLTHTGLHGIETTEMTLEKLFGIKINYNVRVNFSSLIEIVDELGGIDVNNADDFVSQHGGYHFEPGLIHMDGDQTLGFVRERYAFADGDRQRGQNEMRVMQAMIDKATSPAILANFAGVMQTVGHSFQTNMSMDELTGFVNQQIADGAKWKVYSYSVNGSNGTDFAYELGDQASVMYPDKITVSNAKADMDAVRNGEMPPYVNVQ